MQTKGSLPLLVIFFISFQIPNPGANRLSGAGSGLVDSTTLGLHLGDLGGLLASGSVLSLLGLLSGSGGLLLLLGLLDGGSAGSGASLRAHGAALLDHIEGSTNDGTLGLDGAASALLGDLL